MDNGSTEYKAIDEEGTGQVLQPFLRISRQPVETTTTYENSKSGSFNFKLVKQDDDRFFITINREKITGIPVRYNEEDIACIDVPAGYHLGELYYALIDKDIIVGVSGLGVSLQKSIEILAVFIFHLSVICKMLVPKHFCKYLKKFWILRYFLTTEK